MVLKPIREIKKNLFVSLERAPDFWCLGTKTLVPGHQNSGAPTSFCCCLINAHLFMLAMFEEEKNCFCKHFAYAKPCYCAPISTWMNYLYGNCPNAIYWSKCWSTKGPPEPLSNRAGSSSLRRPPLQDTGGFWSYPLLQNFLCWGAIFLVPGHQMISASNPLICNKKSLEKPSYTRTLPA